MPRRKDYTGKKYGRLTAIEYSHRFNKKTYWIFICECGKKKILSMTTVMNGHSRSCGCLHMDRCHTGLNRRRHGDACIGKVKKIHNIWRGMIQRCNNVNTPAYKDYGGRGIIMCFDWWVYENFRDWAYANGYQDKLTIDRIDNDKGYNPNNCRFVTRKEQARNRRNSRMLTYNGKTQCLASWADETGINQYALCARLNQSHWSVEKALTTPIKIRSV